MFSALAPVIGWLGLGGAITAAAIAAAIFLPLFRRLAIEIAIVAAVATTLYGKGVHDGAAFKQAEADAAIAREIKNGDAAHNGAVDDAASGMRDGFARDKP